MVYFGYASFYFKQIRSILISITIKHGVPTPWIPNLLVEKEVFKKPYLHRKNKNYFNLVMIIVASGYKLQR